MFFTLLGKVEIVSTSEGKDKFFLLTSSKLFCEVQSLELENGIKQLCLIKETITKNTCMDGI